MVKLYRVKAIITIDISADSARVLSKIVRETSAHGIRAALPTCILTLGPIDRTVSIINQDWFTATELILLADKKVDADDGENCEYEGLEDANIEQTWYRIDKCLDDHAHTF